MEENITIQEQIAELTREQRLEKLKGIITSKCNYLLGEEDVDRIVAQLDPNVIYHIKPVFTIPYMLRMLTNRLTVYKRPDREMKYGTIDRSKILLGECSFGKYEGDFEYNQDGSELSKRVTRTKCKFNGKNLLVTIKEITKWTVTYKGTLPVSNATEIKHVVYIYLPNAKNKE